MSVGSVVTATKTWVLPPRPKPGRKSKKANDSDDVEDADAACDKSASRTKQKASRERKQEYIAELEAKVRQYEQGDGEKAALFQTLAKKYSAENEELKQQVEALKRQVEQLQGHSQPLISPAGSVPAAVPSLVRKTSAASPTSGGPSQTKRVRRQSSHSRTGSKTPDAIYLPATTTIDPVRSVTKAPSPSYFSVLGPPSPRTAHKHASPSTSAASNMQSPLMDDHGTASSLTSLNTNDAGTPQRHDCAMCDKASGGNCLCDDLGMNHDNLLVEPPSLRIGGCGLCEGEHSMCICEDIGIGRPTYQEVHVPSSSAATTTEITTLTPTAAVPLKLRPSSATKRKIWHLEDAAAGSHPLGSSSSQQSSGLSTGVTLRRQLIRSGSRLPCSGDPRNCAACSDDPAGQAFCSALSKSVCSTNPCANCPNRSSPLTNELPRPSMLNTTSTETRKERASLRRRDSSARDEVPEAMIPCSDAWATLRAHPNIGFAKLDLLAAVVAKRTHCLGEVSTTAEGKVVEVESQGVEEALNILDNIREVHEA